MRQSTAVKRKYKITKGKYCKDRTGMWKYCTDMNVTKVKNTVASLAPSCALLLLITALCINVTHYFT